MALWAGHIRLGERSAQDLKAECWWSAKPEWLPSVSVRAREAAGGNTSSLHMKLVKFISWIL